MSGLLFGRTQRAIDTPFEPNRNPGFGGVPSEIESTDVQAAIEEVKQDAIANDRFVILGSYGGNANVGRYLEFFPSIDSLSAPIFVPVTTRLLSIVVAASASTTGTISFFDLTVSSVTPVYNIPFVAQDRVTLTTTPSLPFYTFPAGAQIAIRVTAGSFSKPYIYFFLGAAT